MRRTQEGIARKKLNSVALSVEPELVGPVHQGALPVGVGDRELGGDVAQVVVGQRHGRDVLALGGVVRQSRHPHAGRTSAHYATSGANVVNES